MKQCYKCKAEIREDQTICYNCYKASKNLREVAPDELILDCDNRQLGDIGIRRICLMFSVDGYRIELYKAEGQKSYHGHIKTIPHIAELPKEQNKIYKELLIKKYIMKVREYLEAPEMDNIDFSLCIPNHLVAEEFKPHFKYKTEKKLISIINENCRNFCDRDIYDLATQEKSEYKINVTGSGITAQITKKISIIDVARRFGIQVNSNGMAICPFHNDSNPSLKFYVEQGRFVCFSEHCNLKGNIIDFYALCKLNLKEIKA